MGGRVLILALCVLGAYSLPAPRSDLSAVDLIRQVERVINIHSTALKAQRSQIEDVLNFLHEIEAIINIHSARSMQDTGVINWPIVADVAEKIGSILGGLKVRSSLTPTQIEEILNQIEGIVNIHSLETRSSLSTAQIDNDINALGKIEGIINVHSAKTISDTGVINWPVVVDVIQSVQGVLVGFKARGSLLSAQEGAIQVEGSAHSVDYAEAPRLSEGVINVPVVIDVINKIAGLVSTLSTRATIDAAEADNILAILSEIEGIVNIHSMPLNARSSLSTAQLENILKLLTDVEGIINIHSQPINPRSTANIIDVLNAIENILQIH